MSSRAKIDMSLGSPLYMKMREALWSAVACYRFRSGQLAGRGRVYRAFGERGRERARGVKAAASCRTPQRLRRLTPVFSIEAARNLLFLFSTARLRYAPSEVIQPLCHSEERSPAPSGAGRTDEESALARR